jgi:hypothetical protein
VTCPRCQTLLEVETEQRREVIECSTCQQEFVGIAEEVIREPDQIFRESTHTLDLCSIFGLMTGLSGVAFFLCPPVGFVLALVGLALSVLGLKSEYRGAAVSGVVFGVVGLIFNIGFFCLYSTAAIVHHEEFGKRNPTVGKQQPVIQFK